MISIIVRFKNEATYLKTVLEAIRAQRIREQIEIVAVDNLSDDGSRLIAAEYADTPLEIDDYRPGAALNAAIEACSGSSLVVLSAHAIPADASWLERLSSWLSNPAVLGTYGAQQYPITSKFLDKRDLDIFSGLRPRTETQDSDFWNANSVFHRSAWEKEKFDENVFELEDHYWTKRHLVQGGRWVRFEPSALVYHYGHESRNDRTFLPPSTLTDEQRVAQAIAVLADGTDTWPAMMSAGLTLSSLSHTPYAASAIPALGHALTTHEDFDVRWRVAGALGRIASAESAGHLAEALADPSFYARDEAAWSLGRLGRIALPTLHTVAESLALEYLPFAALALGLTRDHDAGRRAVEILRRCIAEGDDCTRRDALYFLGEIVHVDDAIALAPMVAENIVDVHDDIARAATWCWGMLAGRNPEEMKPSAGNVIDAMRRHPIETIRYEAVVALGKASQTRPLADLAQHLAEALRNDGAGRVRYAAMQSFRLLNGDMAAATEHDSDLDFGVMFERQLILRKIGQ